MGGSGALVLTDCACIVVVCVWDAAVNKIGEAGAVAIAKALESGQCPLQSLDLRGESMCLAACAAGLPAALPFRLACFCQSVGGVLVRCRVEGVGGAVRC